MFGKKRKKQSFDRANKIPVIHCSICTGEQSAGFKDIHTGKFSEVMLIKNPDDVQIFMNMYGITDKIATEY